MESTTPPLTAPAWTSFITGKKPEHHKLFNFMVLNEELKPRLSSINDVKETKIWEILGKFGLRSIIINFPLAFPPPRINGVFISGMFTPSKYDDFVQPKEYKKFIPKDYIIEPVPVGDIAPSKRLRILKRSLIARFKLFKNFLNENWDFFFILMRETDILQHFFWHNKQILLNFYILIDQKLSNIIKFCEKDNVTLILMSDHGFQELKGEFHIAEFLKRRGYLSLKIKEKKLEIRKKLEKVILEFLVTHPQLKEIVKKLFRIKPRHEPIDIEAIDLSNTKAFHLGDYIYINNDNKEEREKILFSLTREMEREKIECFLLDSKTSYEPVMVISYKNWSFEFTNEESGDIITPPSLRTGTHSLYGIFLAYGQDIKNTGEEIKNLRIYDIAPTILYIFGLPIPKDMDGRILREIFKEDSGIDKRKLKYV